MELLNLLRIDRQTMAPHCQWIPLFATENVVAAQLPHFFTKGIISIARLHSYCSFELCWFWNHNAETARRDYWLPRNWLTVTHDPVSSKTGQQWTGCKLVASSDPFAKLALDILCWRLSMWAA